MTIRTATTKGDRQISVRLTGQVETDRTDREMQNCGDRQDSRRKTRLIKTGRFW